jgi:HSP20 family protein
MPTRRPVLGPGDSAEKYVAGVLGELGRNSRRFCYRSRSSRCQRGDVTVKVENSDLVLQGWRSLEQRHSDDRFHTMERSSGHFMRQMKLPESVEKNAIQAEFRDGVLQ